MNRVGYVKYIWEELRLSEFVKPGWNQQDNYGLVKNRVCQKRTD